MPSVNSSPRLPWIWVFLPKSVAAGEWWRVLTHPLAHVTWYHLLLDASGFLLLYDGLRQGRMLGRLAYVVAAAAGGLLASWLASPAFQEVGFCELSGVAHGLMAVAGLELAHGAGKSRAQRKAGHDSQAATCAGGCVAPSMAQPVHQQVDGAWGRPGLGLAPNRTSVALSSEPLPLTLRSFRSSTRSPTLPPSTCGCTVAQRATMKPLEGRLWLRHGCEHTQHPIHQSL